MSITFALVFLELLLAEFIEWQLVQVQAVQIPGQHLGEGLHGERPLSDELLPAGERGQHGEKLVPQVPRDKHIQVPFNPCHDESLNTRHRNTSPWIHNKSLIK